MNLSGKWKIKAKLNEETGKTSYRTILTSKNKEGETEYFSVFLTLVGAAKNKPIENDTYIIVDPQNAWLSFYGEKDNQTITAMVKDFDYDEQPVVEETWIGDDDLPF